MSGERTGGKLLVVLLASLQGSCNGLPVCSGAYTEEAYVVEAARLWCERFERCGYGGLWEGLTFDACLGEVEVFLRDEAAYQKAECAGHFDSCAASDALAGDKIRAAGDCDSPIWNTAYPDAECLAID